LRGSGSTETQEGENRPDPKHAHQTRGGTYRFRLLS
jgi:hypothetical protein